MINNYGLEYASLSGSQILLIRFQSPRFKPPRKYGVIWSVDYSVYSYAKRKNHEKMNIRTLPMNFLYTARKSLANQVIKRPF